MSIHLESLFIDGGFGEVFLREDLADLTTAITPHTECDEMERRKSVQMALSQLEPREKQVLELKYGFASDPCTYEEIGSRINVCKQRVNQIACKAEGKVLKSVRQMIPKHENCF